MVSAVSVAWACVPAGSISLSPSSGAPGTNGVVATASGFPPSQPVKITWNGPDGPVLATGPTNGSGQYTAQITIPSNVCPRSQPYMVVAALTDPAHGPHSAGSAAFTVTGTSSDPACAPPPTNDPPTNTPITPPPGSGGIQNPVSPLVPDAAGKTINGTAGADKLTGTPFADVINCGAGNDVVSGGGSNDVISCGAGNDRVSGGAGNDRIDGGTGKDRLSGDGGRDLLRGGRGGDRLAGNAGGDRLHGGSGNDRLVGGSGRDRLVGGSGRDRTKQ